MPDDVLQIAFSVQGHTIRITYRQWSHATENHDYMSGNLDKVLETISDPDIIVRGKESESLALRSYDSTNITRKTCVLVYKDEPNGFVITAFLTSKPQKIVNKGTILWSRSPKNGSTGC
ncbi:MAG: hypothetical protein SF123_00400 [Chloroflexota bacterium]|nr:hypothetical protein [Chloroflexota bacterium]